MLGRLCIAVAILCMISNASGQRPRTPARGASTIAGPAYQGDEVACDLPPAEQMKNIGSKIDGAGMCVFTSFEQMARWHGLTDFVGFRDWCAANYPGGGYPQKLDKLVQAYCKAKGIAVPTYIQYEGPNPEEILQQCDKTARLACITYGYGPRYPGTIAHMTNCPKFGNAWAVCLDNNFPETTENLNTLEWMTPAELVTRIKHPSGAAWVVAMVAPSPPPVPHN